MADLLINWCTKDGSEHDESWPSIDTFLSWAQAEGLDGRWTAFEEDEDGDLLLIDSGRMRG